MEQINKPKEIELIDTDFDDLNLTDLLTEIEGV